MKNTGKKDILVCAASWRVLMCAALLGAGTLLPGASFAQDQTMPPAVMPQAVSPPSGDGGQQLPPDFAQQQIPPSFPQDGQTPPAQEGQQPPAAIDQQAGTQLAPGQIPTQPEERKLVPATAMGAAAQNAASGAPPAQDPAEEPQGPDTGNSVEDAASAFDKQMEDPEAAEAIAPPPASDILEQYSAKAKNAAAARGEAEEESLPSVSNLNMVKLEGSGFSNANNTTTVSVDGSLQEGKTSEELQAEIRTEAFDAAITGMFPLNPDQIEGLLERYDETQKAVKTPVYENPRPEISVVNVSLDPGVMPASIKTAVGNVTTINLLDATGAPWPVQDVTWAGDYEVVEPEEGGHIIRITPMSHFSRGNIVIRMLTLKTPLTFSLETGRDVVQYRVDARIPEYGPFASAPIMQGGKSLVAGSPDLTSLLGGIVPGKMIKLHVSGVDGRTTAYSMAGTTYVRTPMTLLSPPWQSSVSSADGMNVYALSSAPVLLLSDGGDFVRATLSEKEDLLDD